MDFKRKMEEAAELAKEAPEGFEGLAYPIILEYLLYSSDDVKKFVKKPSLQSQNKPLNYLDAILKSNFEWSRTQIPKLKPIGQNLFVLKVASDEFNVDHLSPSDIQAILAQKFILKKSANAISMSLMDIVGKYVDRIQQGKEFLYKITSNGREYLDSLIKKNEESE